MSDSIRYLDEDPTERFNGKRKSGNLHKGNENYLIRRKNYIIYFLT